MTTEGTQRPGRSPGRPAKASPSGKASEPAARRRAPDAKARTQRRILDAAAALFTARGYEASSISAIAARARVSRSAIFWHFGDKESLFRETLRDLLAPFIQEMARSLDCNDPSERLLSLVSVYERFVSEQRDAIQAIVRWVIESENLRTSLREPLFALHDHFVHDLRDTLADVIEEPEQAEATALGLVSMLHGNLMLALLDPNPRKERVRQLGLRRMVERALGPALRGSRSAR